MTGHVIVLETVGLTASHFEAPEVLPRLNRLDDAMAPDFARRVDIHRKPGYDPLELFWDPQTRGIPLDPGRVKGSHGRPGGEDEAAPLLLLSPSGSAANLPERPATPDLFRLIESLLGI